MDTKFISPLRAVILEQLARVMTGTAGHYIRVDSLQLGRLTQLLDWIKQNLNQPMGNYALAERLGVSESHFRRIFQETMHCTPHRFIMQLRLERVRQLLTSTTLSIPRIASECGFESQSHMTSMFRSTYGLPPARFRREAGLTRKLGPASSD